MPALGVGNDLGVGESAHFSADRLKSLVEAGVADRAFVCVLDQVHQRDPIIRRVAGL